MRVRDELGELFADAEFTEAFGSRGRPGWSPGQLALVTVLTKLDNQFDADVDAATERVLADLGITHDDDLDDRLEWRLSVVLRHAGRLTESADVPIAAADALRPQLDTPESYSVYGSLMLKGAVGAATHGDHKAVHEYMTEAARAAEVIGDRNDYWFAFGPTNVAIHRTWMSLELSDPTRAIEQASYVQHDQLPVELAERRTSHLITVAWAQYLRKRDREAIDALTEARASAPEQLIFTHRVHAMLRGCFVVNGGRSRVTSGSWPTSSGFSDSWRG